MIVVYTLVMKTIIGCWTLRDEMLNINAEYQIQSMFIGSYVDYSNVRT